MNTEQRVLPLFRCRATALWLAFVAATTVSWWLGSHESGSAAGVAVLAIGCVKGGFVGSDFMELRHAPRPLQLVFAIWITVLLLVLAGSFLAAG